MANSIQGELSKNEFEDTTLAHGVQVHTLILLYNQLLKSNGQDKDQEKTFKEQIAVMIHPKTGAMADQSKETILKTTHAFLQNFLIPDTAYSGD